MKPALQLIIPLAEWDDVVFWNDYIWDRLRYDPECPFWVDFEHRELIITIPSEVLYG